MSTENKDQNAAKTRLCRECATEIPTAARKCKGCGSFQDSRRFFTISQSSVTFFLALLALLAHFTKDIRGFMTTFKDWASGTSFSMDAGLVDFDKNELTIILSSRRNYAFGVSKATCFVNLPADSARFNYLRFRKNDALWGDEDYKNSTELKWVGPILIGYELEAPAFFQPFEVRMITFDRVYTGFPSTQILQKSEEPTSFCSFMGGDQHNSWSVAALVASAENLTDLDALDVIEGRNELERASGEERLRVSLIDRIKQIRQDNSSAEHSE